MASCGSRSVGSGNTNPDEDAGPEDASLSDCQDLWDCNPGLECWVTASYGSTAPCAT